MEGDNIGVDEADMVEVLTCCGALYDVLTVPLVWLVAFDGDSNRLLYESTMWIRRTHLLVESHT
jgi:hypothetical protein